MPELHVLTEEKTLCLPRLSTGLLVLVLVVALACWLISVGAGEIAALHGLGCCGSDFSSNGTILPRSRWKKE